MKVRALIDFFDLKEDMLRVVGDVFDVTDDRFNEILYRGGEWVEAVCASETANDAIDYDYSRMTKAELCELLTEKGIEFNAKASKDKLIEALRA